MSKNPTINKIPENPTIIKLCIPIPIRNQSPKTFSSLFSISENSDDSANTDSTCSTDIFSENSTPSSRPPRHKGRSSTSGAKSHGICYTPDSLPYNEILITPFSGYNKDIPRSNKYKIFCKLEKGLDESLTENYIIALRWTNDSGISALEVSNYRELQVLTQYLIKNPGHGDCTDISPEHAHDALCYALDSARKADCVALGGLDSDEAFYDLLNEFELADAAREGSM